MPRIKGLGELDWNFDGGRPVYSPYTQASTRCLSFVIELNPEFDSVNFTGFICAGGEFTSRGTPFSGFWPDSMERIQKLREVAFATQQLSKVYTHGIRVVGAGPQYLRMTIVVHREDAEIEWPSKFVESIARKLGAWVKEYHKIQK